MVVSTLSPELTDYAAAAREWGRNVAWTHARQADTDHALPPDWEAIVDTCPVPLGRAGMANDELPDFPEGPCVREVVWYETFSYSDLWVEEALNRGVGHLVVEAIGTDEQKRRWYDPVMAEGGHRTGFGLTEPNTGSDTSAMATTATKDGDSWVINGSKMFCSLGAIADYVVVLARIAGNEPKSAIQSFVVERGWPGFDVVKANEDKLGLRCWTTSQLSFDNVVVPAEHLLGWQDSRTDVTSLGGLNAALAGLNDSRPVVSAMSVGVAWAALDVTKGLLHESKKWVAPHRWSLIQDELERMEHSLSRARQLNLAAGWLRDAGLDNRTQVATCKAYGPINADRVIRRCMQLLGPEGTSTDLLLEKWYRDIKIFDIFEGTGQIMRMLVSRSLMGRGAAAS